MIKRFLLALLCCLLWAVTCYAQQTAGRPGTSRAVTAATDTATAADFGGIIAFTSTTAAATRTETLPLCNASSNGAGIVVVDQGGRAAQGAEIKVGAVSPSTVAGATAGTALLLIGANLGSVELACDGVSNWNVTASSNPGASVLNPTVPVTAGQWFSGALFQFTTAGQTLTLPPSAIAVANGGITVQAIGTSVTVVPSGSDTLSGAGANVAGTTVTVPSNAQALITFTGGTTFAATIGAAQFETITWLSGMNLNSCAAPPCPIPIFRTMGSPRTIGSILCRPEIVAGGTATLDVYMTAAEPALLSTASTKLNSAQCNANTGAGTTQTLGLAAGQGLIPAFTLVGAIATGWGAGAALGSGVLEISLQ